MIYNNLLLFLVAIFLFSVDSVPDAPLLPPLAGLLLFIVSIVGFDLLCRRRYRSPVTLSSAGYFKAEKYLSVLSLVFYGAGALYLCDAKYHLSFLSFGDRLPALVNIGGLALFLLYLSLMWRAARRNYQHVFGRQYSSRGFIFSNLKVNLPIVLPWVILSLCYDLLTLVPFPPIQDALTSQWGDLLFFVLFLFFVVLFFPPLVRRLWGCRPMPDSLVKEQLTEFCRKQSFSANLYIWPLFEGRVLTAGVMGIVPGMRYILLTPAIIETMSMEELESVMAHEIGHVKRYHLLLYILLIGGFSLFAGMLAEPFIFFLLSREFFVGLITGNSVDPEMVLTAVGGVPLLLFMLVYFRFVFGFFIRNFERQADLHVLTAVGSGRALVSAFEKISRLSGDIRDQKNWHHFGIGERIDCIQQAEADSGVITRHDRKVRRSLIIYLLVLVAAFAMVQKIPTDKLSRQYEEKYAEAVLLEKASQEPDQAIWQRLMGDLMLSRNMEQKALDAYEKALDLDPDDAVIMNNLAWLLLTSENLELRDPYKALMLARDSADIEPSGYILDTLATAYWANGFTEKAVETEERAAFVDPNKRRFYMSQAARFIRETYEESVAEQKIENAKKVEE